jgi:zeaxanthin epoxidase
LTEVLAGTKTTEKLEDALQEFYRKRILRVSTVQFMSRLASDLIINAFDTPWSPHDNLGTSWKSYLTLFWKPFLQFIIFPLQFAYLYSYHPTGSMAETAAALEEEWRLRHFESSEEAFALADEGFKRTVIPSFFQKAEAKTTVLAAKKE